MKPTKGNNPFTPGTGNRPPLLAGREEEIELLTLMLERLDGPRAKKQVRLAREPFPPIKIVGPRGVGKTTLLTWAREAAAKMEVPSISCAYLEEDGTRDPMQVMVDAMKNWPAKIFDTFKDAGITLPGGFGVNFKTDRPDDTYIQLLNGILEKKPLLILLDEVHHFNLRHLGKMLQINQQMVSRGLPLGVVLAGTPALDGHLQKAKATFIVRSEEIYINVLSDAATRKALLAPFKKAKLTVMPNALEAMAAQTDNYPFFIQLVGRAVWDEMATSGRDLVDTKLVANIKERAREKRESLYGKAYREIRTNQLMPYARQVMSLIDSNGGKVPEDDVIDALVEENADVDGRKAEEIYVSLCEDGFIWTVGDETVPGIPSFFSYLKARQKKKARKP